MKKVLIALIMVSGIGAVTFAALDSSKAGQKKAKTEKKTDKQQKKKQCKRTCWYS